MKVNGKQRSVSLPALNQWNHIQLDINYTHTIDVEIRPNINQTERGGLGIAAVVLESMPTVITNVPTTNADKNTNPHDTGTTSGGGSLGFLSSLLLAFTILKRRVQKK